MLSRYRIQFCPNSFFCSAGLNSYKCWNTLLIPHSLPSITWIYRRNLKSLCYSLTISNFGIISLFPNLLQFMPRTWWSNRRWRGRPEGKPLTRIFWLRHPDTLAIPWPMAVFWFMTYTGPSSSTSLSSSSCQCCHTIAVPLYFIVIYTVLQWHLFEILLQLSPAAAEWWYGMVRHKQNKTFPASR